MRVTIFRDIFGLGWSVVVVFKSQQTKLELRGGCLRGRAGGIPTYAMTVPHVWSNFVFVL